MKCEIHLDSHGHGKVFIDGKEIDYIRSLTLTSEVNGLNLLSLECFVSQVDVIANEVEVTTYEQKTV